MSGWPTSPSQGCYMIVSCLSLPRDGFCVYAAINVTYMMIKRPCYMLSIWITICLPLISVLLYYYLFDPFLNLFTFVVYRIRYLLIARMLRLIRLLMHVQQYRAFVATFLTLIPSLMPYLGTIFCILCVYCSLGVQVHQCLIFICLFSFILHFFFFSNLSLMFCHWNLCNYVTSTYKNRSSHV